MVRLKKSAVELCSEILTFVNNDLSQLGKLSIKDLMKFKGIGEAKAISIVAAMELGRRRQAENLPEVQRITSTKSIYQLFLSDLADLPYEEFWVLILNARNKVLGKEKISMGGITATAVDLRVLFKLVFDRLGTAIIVIHNHPGGSLKPSPQDIQLTNRIKEAGKILDIKLIDHVIVSDNGYYSFSDSCML
ncbi:MAG: DNA repair protein RadC [Chitinophagales bacterium]|nr:DNA repair protein RadC [Chitinophagales bacterium]